MQTRFLVGPTADCSAVRLSGTAIITYSEEKHVYFFIMFFYLF